ncbi:MAG: hypothetical protein HQL91_09745 [Magnetococcales bacterium]|nr:hypothetical protein [Magnetococcales bacterium]
MIIKGESRTVIMSIGEFLSVESFSALQRSLEEDEFDKMFICTERIKDKSLRDFMVSFLAVMPSILEMREIVNDVEIEIINCPEKCKEVMSSWCDAHSFHINECVTCPASASSLVNALGDCVVHPCAILNSNYFCLE